MDPGVGAGKWERTRRDEVGTTKIRDIVCDKRVDMPKKASNGKSVRRVRTANWKCSLDTALLRILRQEYIEGNFVNGQFTASAWSRIVPAFNTKTGLDFNKGHLQNRLKVLRNIFRMYNGLATMSGWRWDPDANVPKPDDPCCWESTIAVNPQYAKCRDKPFPAYPILKLIFMKHTSNQSGTDAMPADLSDKEEDSSSSLRSSDEKDTQSPNVGNKDDADDADDVSAPSDNTSSGFSERTSRALEELVRISQRQQEIAAELLDQEMASRPKTYSVEQCMSKLNTVRNLSSEAFLAACEAFRDKHERRVFMNLKGPNIRAWIDKKLAMQQFTHGVRPLAISWPPPGPTGG